MGMLISYAIAFGWLAIGILCLCGMVYLVLRIIKVWWPIEPRVELTIWLIVLLLCVIAALTILGGGGGAVGAGIQRQIFPRFN